jgi:hypothetical protein
MADLAEQKKAILPYLQVRFRACGELVVCVRVQADAFLLCILLPTPPRALPSTPTTTQRAEEVASVDPKVAYYCRMWAVDQVSGVCRTWREAPASCPARSALCGGGARAMPLPSFDSRPHH